MTDIEYTISQIEQLTMKLSDALVRKDVCVDDVLDYIEQIIQFKRLEDFLMN